MLRKFGASSSVFGSMMESSYRRQAATQIMLAIDEKGVATLNATGAKSRAITDATSIPSPWATTLPVTSLRTFPVKVVISRNTR